MNASERRATFALASIFALRMLGLFMIIPVFSIAGQHYHGATPALLGLAIGIYGLFQALFQIPVSLLADRFSRKPLIVFGLLLFALGGAIAALSDSITGVIIGRAVAGSGAVSAVVMALLADVTREEQRTKAMATMGMSIALSFIVAFTLGPWLHAHVGMSGLFWVTSGAGLLAIVSLLLVPTPRRLLPQRTESYRHQLQQVIRLGDINRLHSAIFLLHLLMTAAFVLIPIQLVNIAHLPPSEHATVYLPLMLLGFVLAIPGIIIAEARRQMRGIFILAMLMLSGSYGVLLFTGNSALGLLVGLGFFFCAFNVLEALLPSWLAKLAPVASKATAMGINSTAQFLGAFFGGVLGGQLLSHTTGLSPWAILGGLSLVGIILAMRLSPPPYLSSLAFHIPERLPLTSDWLQRVMRVRGVEDVVLLEKERVAYLKVDKKQLDNASRQELSSLTGQTVEF